MVGYPLFLNIDRVIRICYHSLVKESQMPIPTKYEVVKSEERGRKVVVKFYGRPTIRGITEAAQNEFPNHNSQELEIAADREFFYLQIAL